MAVIWVAGSMMLKIAAFGVLTVMEPGGYIRLKTAVGEAIAPPAEGGGYYKKDGKKTGR